MGKKDKKRMPYFAVCAFFVSASQKNRNLYKTKSPTDQLISRAFAEAGGFEPPVP